jgi:hypothetical protein
MNLTTLNVNKTFKKCLFQTGEPTEPHIQVDGVKIHTKFHPKRLKKELPNIISMLNDLPESFQEEKGRGSSYLNACIDKNGNQWAEQSTVELLVCLGLASGKLKFPFQRDFWHTLPGGMPYLVITK